MVFFSSLKTIGAAILNIKTNTVNDSSHSEVGLC